MAYTLAQTITEVRRLLNETVAAFYTDAEITEWIAQGTLDVSSVSKSVEAHAAIGVALETWAYTLPADCIEVLHVVWDETKQGLRKITASMTGESTPDVTGNRPMTWFEWGNTLYIMPLPDVSAAGKNLHVFYALATSDVTLLRPAYQWLPITFAAYRAKLKDKRFGEAATLFADYANGLAERKLDINQRIPHTEADLQLAARLAPVGG